MFLLQMNHNIYCLNTNHVNQTVLLCKSDMNKRVLQTKKVNNGIVANTKYLMINMEMDYSYIKG